jgi:hypothetical protein
MKIFLRDPQTPAFWLGVALVFLINCWFSK